MPEGTAATNTNGSAEAHTLPVFAVADALHSDLAVGLATADAARRLSADGANELPPPPRQSLLLLFLRQFFSVLDGVLIAATILSFALGEFSDGFGILIALLIDAVVGFVQERRAEESIARLKDLVVPEAAVLRDGRATRIPAREVVPGDLLLLTAGARVAADARLVDARELQADEASLTGESTPAAKQPGELPPAVPLAERTNMVYMGTVAVTGEGRAVVVATGIRTELGRIARSLERIERPRTPFEKRIDALGRDFAVVTIVLSVLVFVLGLFHGNTVVDMFFFSVATAVSVIPEGLPTVLAVVLAIAARRMAHRRAIVRHLPSVETLGAAEIICTDKTGTLTMNRMTAREIALADGTVSVTGEGYEAAGEFTVGGQPLRPDEMPRLHALCLAAALCNAATIEWKGERAVLTGDPTEAALLVLARKAGFERHRLLESYRVVDELPFTSVRRYRAVLVEHRDESGERVREIFAVGAVGTLLDVSSSALSAGETVDLGRNLADRFRWLNDEMASRALRVIAVTMRRTTLKHDRLAEKDVAGLVLLGLVGMIDPPRPGASAALERCRRAGIRVIMLTGDQRRTAVAVAREVGLLPPDAKDDDRRAFSELDVRDLPEKEFRARLAEAAVFARVSPDTKLRIVNALEEQGHVTAMTGDGVNDAPALKRASIGIAMGVAGTDVAKEVADMVLADDDFTTIVNAVEEGRTVFRTVKQTTAYLFATNVGEVVTLLAAIILGLPLPLLPAQVLWMNLVTDGLPDVALATERGHGSMLNGASRPRAAFLSRYVLLQTAVVAAFMAVGSLALFVLYRPSGLAYARTMVFASLSCFQLWNVFNMRSVSTSLFKLGFRSNPYVFASVLISFGLQLIVLYVPPIAGLFRAVPLTLRDWLLILCISSSALWSIEAVKLLMRRGVIPRSWT